MTPLTLIAFLDLLQPLKQFVVVGDEAGNRDMSDVRPSCLDVACDKLVEREAERDKEHHRGNAPETEFAAKPAAIRDRRTVHKVLQSRRAGLMQHGIR